MIYVISDLHGWPLEKFKALLERSGFGDEDFLFVLGDVIDRGDESIDLLRWMAVQPNVQLIMGNHESMMLACTFLFTGEKVNKDGELDLTEDDVLMLYNWIGNGGKATLEDFVDLIRKSPEEAQGVLDYIREAPLYEELTVNGRKFILVHAGLDNFSPDRPLSDYAPDELIWTRPELDTAYFEDATVIFGHTPTLFYGEQYRGKPVYGKGWVCIDAGAAGGIRPVLLRLDDMKEFY